ncbi:MAG: DUF4956 domain-containing protein [Bifidobacteriaceae bacterium]|jgi:hypothetical protein|nr:DUF4956 domain-containing protein [Bifidobacteriaceae bacterium]
MFSFVLAGADAVAITILTLALYYPRHKRRDLLVSYLAVNVGVLAVAAALAETSVNVGLGLGLFGVLAIIRLRSAELGQHEIAYYFASLALGLIGGLAAPMGWVAVALMGAIVAVLAAADIGGAARRDRSQTVLLTGVLPPGAELARQLEALLGEPPASYSVRKLDAVRNETTVTVHLARSADGTLRQGRGTDSSNASGGTA